jgi:hypothetical protein
MSDKLFSSLIRELEKLLGVSLNLAPDESLQFHFDDDLLVSISPDRAQEALVIDVDLGKSSIVGNEPRNDHTRLLLQLNHHSRLGKKVFTALGPNSSVVLTHSVPMSRIDAGGVTDLIDMMVTEAQQVRTLMKDLDSKKASGRDSQPHTDLPFDPGIIKA